MKLPTTPWKATSSEDWLVIEFNGFRCRAISFRSTGQEYQIQHDATALEDDVESSFNKVIAEITEATGKVPSKGILVTSQAAASILSLPINPTLPVKPEQLQSLVQWEFEQVLSEHTATLSLETILAGRGQLTESEVDDVRLAIGAEKATTSCIAIPPKKFGDQTVKMGYATEDVIRTNLALLETFTRPDDAPICHFFPLEPGDFTTTDEGFSWLVCGIGESSKAQWIQRFANSGIRLERIYPLGFNAAAARGDSENEDTVGFISLLDGADCYTAFVEDRMTSLRWGPAPLSPRNPGALRALVGDDSIDELWIAGREDLIATVTPLLDQDTGYTTRPMAPACPMNPQAAQTPQENIAELVGAFHHQKGISPLQIPWVEGAPPPPPWWQQSTKWWRIMGLLLSCLVLISETTLGLQRRSVTMATKEVNSQMSTAQGEIAKVQQQASTADQLIKRRRTLRDSNQITKQAVDLIDIGLTLRQKYVTELYASLADAVSPAIAIDAFRERSDHSVEIDAWALSETDAQEFIHDLTTKLEPWGMGLDHQEVRAGSGRLGLMGYDLALHLKPDFFTPRER